MLQLLAKDIRIQKKFIALGFVFIGFVFFILGAFEGMPMSVPAAIFGHFLIVASSKSDEKNNNGRMLASFPLRRIDIVTAKYAGILMFMAIAFLLTFLWRVLTGFLLPVQELPWFSMQSTVLTIAALLVFYSIYFPILFATGSRLVQVLDLIVIFSVGGVVLLAIRVLEWMNIHIGQSLRDLLTSDNISGLLGVLCASVILLVLSWSISLYAYKKRNL